MSAICNLVANAKFFWHRSIYITENIQLYTLLQIKGFIAMGNQLEEISALSEAAQELLLRSAEQGKDWTSAIELIMIHISSLSQSTQ